MDAHIDDAELLARWAEGCQDAGARLFERYCVPLQRFFDGKAPDAADDLTQATLLVCVERANTLRQRRGFRSFLFGIARNLLYQHYRGNALKRDKRRFNTTSMLDRAPSPSLHLRRRTEDLQLHQALASLPVDTRILLELAYWEELSPKDLAEVLEIPENTVHSRLHRAKRKLRAALSQLESTAHA